MKFICHVTSRKRMLRGISDFAFRHVTPNHKPPFHQVYMTLCENEIKRLCDFVD